MKKITYQQIEDAVRTQCAGLYPMSFPLGGTDYLNVAEAVNLGIDSRLEACFLDGVDTYRREAGVIPRLECRVSGHSLAVLLRRLFEATTATDAEEPDRLATDILCSLGLASEDDYGTIEVISPVDEPASGEPYDEAQAT